MTRSGSFNLTTLSKQNGDPESPVAAHIDDSHKMGTVTENQNNGCLCLIPVLVFLIMVTSTIVTYIISVSIGHVPAILPYVSSTGTRPPESCIFGELLTIGTILGSLTMYIRYRQVVCLRVEPARRWRLVNRASLVCGVLSAFGFTLVASFQVSVLMVPHFFGATVAFSFGLAYMWLQTLLSYKVGRAISGRCMRLLQLLISLVCTASGFISGFTGAAGRILNVDAANRHGWLPTDHGYSLHIVSAAAEYLMIISLLSFFLTFASEFQRLRCRPAYVIDTRNDHQVLDLD